MISRPRRSLATVGLFAGIGGLELGLERAGHETVLLCEIEEAAKCVLRNRFPRVGRLHDDVRELKATHFPERVDMITAGFPCQDLSQVGRAAGINGRQSGLYHEIPRLLRERQQAGCPVPWLLLENVAFMRHLYGGSAMEVVLGSLEQLGYHWAYRLVDSISFGRPQRRKRIYFLACLPEHGSPADVLLADDAGASPSNSRDWNRGQESVGFYWTEGTRGLGWAKNAVPTLKGGSTIGIPSPPAVLLPSGEVIKPDIRDAERLQGLPANWTRAAEKAGAARRRWKLVGNAVSVDVANWIGRRLANPKVPANGAERSLERGEPWPPAARFDGQSRIAVDCSEWPVARKLKPIHEFLTRPGEPLSHRATLGFFSRLCASNLAAPDSFRQAIEDHVESMASA